MIKMTEVLNFILAIITIPFQLFYGLILYPIVKWIRGNF